MTIDQNPCNCSCVRDSLKAALEKAGIVFISSDQQGGQAFGCATFPQVRANEDVSR